MGVASRFSSRCYRSLFAGSMGTQIKVIRLLVRELLFFVCQLYLENDVVTCFLDFEFSFYHYKTRDSGIMAYDDSKIVYGRSAYDNYFARNQSRKKLKNASSDFSYTHTFPYVIRPINVLSINFFELFFVISYLIFYP